MEEFGGIVTVGAFVGAVEHAYNRGDTVRHEINIVFAGSADGLKVSEAPPALESNLEFLWHPVAHLTAVNVQPEPIRRLVLAVVSGQADDFWQSTIE
jgi:hypothetical protein